MVRSCQDDTKGGDDQSKSLSCAVGQSTASSSELLAKFLLLVLDECFFSRDGIFKR